MNQHIRLVIHVIRIETPAGHAENRGQENNLSPGRDVKHLGAALRTKNYLFTGKERFFLVIKFIGNVRSYRV